MRIATPDQLRRTIQSLVETNALIADLSRSKTFREPAYLAWLEQHANKLSKAIAASAQPGA